MFRRKRDVEQTLNGSLRLQLESVELLLARIMHALELTESLQLTRLVLSELPQQPKPTVGG